MTVNLKEFLPTQSHGNFHIGKRCKNSCNYPYLSHDNYCNLKKRISIIPRINMTTTVIFFIIIFYKSLLSQSVKHLLSCRNGKIRRLNISGNLSNIVFIFDIFPVNYEKLLTLRKLILIVRIFIKILLALKKKKFKIVKPCRSFSLLRLRAIKFISFSAWQIF